MIVRTMLSALAVVSFSTASASAQQTIRLIDIEAAKACSFVDTQITATDFKLSDFDKWDKDSGRAEQKLRASAMERALKASGNAIIYRDLNAIYTAHGILPMLMFDIYRCPD